MQASPWTGSVDLPTLILQMTGGRWTPPPASNVEPGWKKLDFASVQKNQKSCTLATRPVCLRSRSVGKNSRWLRGLHTLAASLAGTEIERLISRAALAKPRWYSNKCEISGHLPPSQPTSRFISTPQPSSQWKSMHLKGVKRRPVLPGRWTSSTSAAFEG